MFEEEFELDYRSKLPVCEDSFDCRIDRVAPHFQILFAFDFELYRLLEVSKL